jgi:5'-3' exonuclease
MIFIDFSVVAHQSVFAELNRSGETAISLPKTREIVNWQLSKIKKMFEKEYGNGGFVVAIDSKKGYWRRDLYPGYKKKRREERKASPVDWPQIFEALGAIISEIKKFLPVRAIEVDRAEADDIIGSLIIANAAAPFGGNLWPAGRDLIVSSDSDMAQLQAYGAAQWNPVKKKFAFEPDPRLFLKMKIIKGDSSDEIPNIKNPLSIFESPGKRQAPARKDFIFKALNDFDSLSEAEKLRFRENEKLIDMRLINPEISAAVIRAFKDYKFPAKNKAVLYEMAAGFKL